MAADSGPPDFYEDRGLNAEIYDLRTATYTANSGDVSFYVDLARETGGPVLELAAGTGRVSFPLAEAGIDVTGLDLSPGMLRAANEHYQAAPPEVRARLRFVRGDMRSFDLGRAFSLVLIPFRGFMALLTPEDQRACLQAVYRHLEPGGRLCFALFDPLLSLIADEEQPDAARLDWQGTHPVTGNRVVCEVVARTNVRLAQVLHETWQFTEFDSAGSPVRREQEVLRMRWSYRHEMRYLLELTGFQVEAEYSDFAKSPPAYGREQIWLARRP